VFSPDSLTSAALAAAERGSSALSELPNVLAGPPTFGDGLVLA